MSVRLATACALAMGVIHAPAYAVQPAQWLHDSEADFTAGKSEKTVVTNLGDIKLAASSDTLGEMPEDITILYDMQARANGDLYIAAGGQGTLLVRKGDEIQSLLKLENEQIFTLELGSDGKLLVGISGEKSRIAQLQDDNTLKTVVELPDTRYVWDMKSAGKLLYLATGTQGKLLKVDLAEADKPAITELLATEQANLLCLAMGKDGQIYAGSDSDGLVYRVTESAEGQPQAFVVYDADEPEIGALWVDAQGVLYVGTADAEQARPGRLEAASQGGQGRPSPQDTQPATDPSTDNAGDKPADAPSEDDLPDDVTPKPQPVKPPGKEAGSDAGDDKDQGEQGKPDTDTPAMDQPVVDKDAPAADPMRQMILQKQREQLQETPKTKLPQPTAEQRDELRAVIRQRLEQAKQSGTLQSGASARRITTRQPAASARSSVRPSRSGPTKQGNAVYRITPDGFVSEVFRESVMILNLAGLPDGSLLIATGNEGRLFRVNPANAEVTRLIKLESQQITAILPGPDGDMLLGTANPATLSTFSPSFAEEGSFTSPVLDASQISLFGQLNIVATIPEGTAVQVSTRSGNVGDPDKGPWSAWSDPVTLTSADDIDSLAPRTVAIDCPPARFLQYQLTLKSGQGKSPTVDQVAASFVVPNLKPSIASVTVNTPGTPPAARGGQANPSQPRPIGKPAQANPGGAGGGRGGAAAAEGAPAKMDITWEATDPNSDQLTYTLEYKPANASVWLPLAKDLSENRYEWQTRRVPDGRYVVRVTASDAADNTPSATLTDSRSSDPVLIDNTPPTLQNIQSQSPAKGALTITGLVRDNLSAIRGVQYAIDAGEQWHYVLADDLIYDSTAESFTVKIFDLAPGQHVLTLRAEDARGNATYEALIVDIK